MVTIVDCDYWEGNIGYPSDLASGCAVHKTCESYVSTPKECKNNCFNDQNCRVAVYSSSTSKCYPKGYNRGKRQPADNSKTCYEKQYVGLKNIPLLWNKNYYFPGMKERCIILKTIIYNVNTNGNLSQVDDTKYDTVYYGHTMCAKHCEDIPDCKYMHWYSEDWECTLMTDACGPPVQYATITKETEKSFTSVLKTDSCAYESSCKSSQSSGCVVNRYTEGYTCTCLPGYEGADCGTQTNLCLQLNPCQNGASCTPSFNDYSCACLPGYEGADCGTQTDFCLQLNPCQNGASCHPIVNDYMCACLPGYEGKKCDIQTDHCLQLDPCENGATCDPMVNGYRCECAHGYSGVNCTLFVGYCFPTNPCGNGGICKEDVSSFSCDCTGITGGLKSEELTDTCDLCTKDAFNWESGVLERKSTVTYLEECTYLDLSALNLTTIDSNAFLGLTQLTYLDLTQNSIDSIPYGVFDLLEEGNLYLDNETKCTNYGFAIENGKISIKTGHAYDYVKDCAVLNLTASGIKTFESNIFQSLTSLSSLDLSYNLVEEIPCGFDDLFFYVDEGSRSGSGSGSGSGNGSLQMLQLQFNRIKKICEGSLGKLPFITKLFMNDNQLEEIPQFLFSNIRGTVEIFNFTSNPIRVINKDTFSVLLNNKSKDNHDNIETSSINNDNNNKVVLYLENNTLSCCDSINEIMSVSNENTVLSCYYNEKQIWNNNKHNNNSNITTMQNSCTMMQNHNTHQSNSNTIIIIIVCVVVVFLLLVGVGIIVFIYKKKQKTQKLLFGQSAQSFVMEGGVALDSDSVKNYSKPNLQLTEEYTVPGGYSPLGAMDTSYQQIDNEPGIVDDGIVKSHNGELKGGIHYEHIANFNHNMEDFEDAENEKDYNDLNEKSSASANFSQAPKEDTYCNLNFHTNKASGRTAVEDNYKDGKRIVYDAIY